MVIELIGLSGVAGSGKSYIANVIHNKYGFAVVSLADQIKRICKDVFDFTDDQLWGPSEKRNEPDKRYSRLTEPDSKHYILEEQDNGTVHVDRDDGSQKLLLTFQEWEALKKQTEYLTPRYALQKLGTEWGRNCYEPIWIEYTMRVAKKLIEEPFKHMYSAQNGLESLISNAEIEVLHPAKGVVIPDVRFKNEMEAVRQAGGKVVRIYGRPTTLSNNSATHSSEKEQLEIPDLEFDYILQNSEDSTTLLKSIRRMMVALA